MKSTPAHVLCGTQGSGLGQCRTRHLGPSRETELPEALGDWPDIRGLNQLQASRETWLNGDAIEKALKSYYESLPAQTRRRIHIADTSIRGIFHTGEREFRNMLSRPYPRFFNAFMQTEYSLWPLNYDDIHWELAVVHKGKTDETTGRWDRVLHIAIIDAWKDASGTERNQMISYRLRHILEKSGLTFAADCERVVWVPWQKDNWSCGLRVYWSAKQILDRLARDMAEGRSYDEQLWAPMGGWFNPDAVRWEMIGLNAYEAVKEMDYRARIAVELTDQAKNGAGKLQDAGDVMRPPARGSSGKKSSKKAGEDDDVIEVPPEVPDRRLVAIPIPNERRIAPSWPIKQGDLGVPRRSARNNSVWSRINQGQPPVRSTPRRPVVPQGGALFKGDKGFQPRSRRFPGFR
ncbi:hypothetical protein F4781DRAFT_425989 [Annulohypoxylon bovei var. microspora]|nr:hypothetical protein F4781DRAFT_425989 [Annulohypoxylon bovei var. microspora]